MNVAACVAGGIALLAAVFVSGIYVERLRWSRLIRDGLLPKPGEWRRSS